MLGLSLVSFNMMIHTKFGK
uniref:Uncharacterized protein n=1 Tax=Heterorhabditis bacteriophora TaxID=37862 RepID=A0A1I7WV15_HETBA